MRFSPGILLAAVMIPATAAAQVPPADTIFRLPVLNVGAARTTQRVLDVPLAMTIVPRSDFSASNGHRLDGGLRNVPGVLSQTRYGGTDIRIVIRGFGARGAGDRSNAGTSRGVRFLQDGIPETEPDGRTAFDLVDLAAIDRIEVVRSNASSLWGNAAGGLVNFSSVPTATNSGAAFQYQTGAFGLNRQVAQARSVMGSTMVYGTAVHTELDGWRANSAANRNLINLGVVAGMGETRLRAHAIAADNQFNIPGPLTLAQVEANPEQSNATYATRKERRRNRIGRLGIELEHDVTDNRTVTGMVYVNPKYLQRSERGTFRDFTRYHVGGNATLRDEHTLSSSLRGALSFGMDEAYQDGAIQFYGLTADGERNAAVVTDNKREAANNFGVFAQELLAFGSKLDLTLGLRWDNIKYQNQSFVGRQLSSEKTFKRLTPKVGLLYRFPGDHTVYANLGGGVEAPAGNETDPVGTFGQDTIYAINPLLEPISSTTLEVGTKRIMSFSGRFLRTISYDAALYRTNVTNEIVPYRGGRFYFTAAKAERRGAELGVRASTAPGLSIATSWTLSDSRYRDYVVDSVHYSLARAGVKADYSDNKIVGVPDFFFNVDLEYAPPFAKGLGFEVEVQNVGKYFADDANTVEVPSYNLFHAGVNLNRPIRIGGGLELGGFARLENITDETYIGSAFLNPDVVGGVPVAFEPGMPRHLVVSLSLGWSRP